MADGSKLAQDIKFFAAASRLREVSDRLLSHIERFNPEGKFESDVEARNLIKLIIKHSQALVLVANTDLSLFPSAVVLARSAYETAIRTIWLLDPKDPMERELRWLVHLKAEEEFLAGYFSSLETLGGQSKDAETLEKVREFRIAAESIMSEEYKRKPINKMPNLRDMLGSLSEHRKYPLYRWGSQYVHGTHSATWLYRRNLGNMKRLGEFINPSDWVACLKIIWYSLHAPGELFLERTGGDPREFLPVEFGTAIQSNLDDLLADYTRG